MKSVLASLGIAGILIAGFVHAARFTPQTQKLLDARHLPKAIVADQPATASDPSASDSSATVPAAIGLSTPDQSTPDPQNQPMVIMVSPLAKWLARSNSAKPGVEETSAETPQPADRAAPSSAGGHSVTARNRTLSPPQGIAPFILHKTFTVSNSVNFPFEIPAHAMNAHLRGNYHSSNPQESTDSADKGADVGLLLMNEEQYADFAKHGSAEVLMSLDPSREQNVNFSIPISGDQPAKYYVVFRNTPREGKKTVQADFKVDF
jgi:hypothetical protein